MAKVVLKIDRLRHNIKSTTGTLGIFYPFKDGTNVPRFCYTLELPWAGNMTNLSCIPPGRHTASVRTDGKKGWRLELQNTGRRKNIQIHVGNKPSDIDGCILLGNTCAGDFVGNSRVTVAKLKAELSKAKAPLEIVVEISDPLFRQMDASMSMGGMTA